MKEVLVTTESCKTDVVGASSKKSGSHLEVNWSEFPSRKLPVAPETRIDIDKLEELVDRYEADMLVQEVSRARRAISYLREGAPAFQKTALKSCYVENKFSSPSSQAAVLETVRNWVNKGFAAGPFKEPPLDNFRVNSMIAVIKGEKTRPVLNVSEPAGTSFNDNVDKHEVERVVMDTARSFSYALLEAGMGARMDKTDVKDAFKNVPARLEDLRLQGFKVFGKFFVELRMIFGASTALANYDVVGNTVEKLAIAESKIPRRFVKRAVDDQPTASPANKSWGKDFVESYKRICAEINLELAEDCKNCDKAFTDSTCGKVLGFWFRSTDLTWSLPVEKRLGTLKKIAALLGDQAASLHILQSLMGSLNNVCMMCPFLKIFRFNLNREMAIRIENESLVKALSKVAKDDLLVFGGVLLKEEWLPIIREPSSAPPCAICFTSDAAGLPENRQVSEASGRAGCASVGFDSDGSMIFAAQMFWPDKFIMSERDNKGSRFGDKTSTLETVGIMLPFLLAPKLVAGRHVVAKVDNLACVYGFENGQMKHDESASILIRTTKLIAAYLGSVLHVEHLPRRSCWEAELADNMTRTSTTGFLESRSLARFPARTLPDSITGWLDDPQEDWTLPSRVLKDIVSLMNN